MSSLTPAPAQAVHVTTETAPPAGPAVDARQDELMAVKSPDGMPPTHRNRRIGWILLSIALPLVLLAGVTWAIIEGMSARAVIGYGIAGLIAVGLGAWPAWGAALSRGKEERAARKQAVAEQPAGPEARQAQERNAV